MMKIWLSCCTAILLIGNLFAQEEFTKYLDAFAKAGTILAPPPEGKVVDDKLLSQLQQELEQIRFPSELQPEMDLMQLRILYAQGKYQEVIDQVEAQSKKYQVMMPDWLFFENYSYMKLNKRYDNKVTLLLGELLPFSFWGYSRDEILGPSQFRFGHYPVSYGLYSEQFGKLANMFYRAKDSGEYINHLLMYFYNNSQSEFLVNTSVYMMKGEDSVWSRIGKTEKQLGHERLTQIAYLRAAYDLPSSVADLKHNWNESIVVSQVPKEIPQKIALECAILYKNGQLYPWALEVLTRSNIKDENRYASYKNEFIDLVRIAHQQSPAAYFMGVPVVEITDFDNFHLAKPSETFWNEETLYVSKEEVAIQ